MEKSEDDKKKKTKKKKKNKKCIKTNSLTSLLTLTLLGGVVYFMMFPVVPPTTRPATQAGLSAPLVNARGVNTTSTPYRRAALFSVPNFPSSSRHYHILCMHHLRRPDPMRVCAMYYAGQRYILANPRWSPPNDDIRVTKVTEKSVSCVDDAVRERFECVDAHWEDPMTEFIVQAHGLCGPPAIALQLATDEFEGAGHCAQLAA